MSQENVEVVHRIYDEFNRRGPDGVAPLYHPEIEWHDLDILPDAGVHHGRDAGVEALRRYTEVADFQIEVTEVIDAGTRTVAAWHLTGEAVGSGVPVELEIFHVWEVRDGMASLLLQYTDRGKALEAAGLHE